MWYNQTMDYYSTMKWYLALIHGTTWLNFEKVMLSERIQSQRTMYYMIPFI